MKRKVQQDSENSCDESSVKVFAEEMVSVIRREMGGEGEVDTDTPFQAIWEELEKSNAMLDEAEGSSDESPESEAEWQAPVVGGRTINPLLKGLVDGDIVSKVGRTVSEFQSSSSEQSAAEESEQTESEESEAEESEAEESEAQQSGSDDEEEEVRRPIYTNRFALLDSDEEDKPAPKRQKVVKKRGSESDAGFVQGGGVVTETLVEGSGERIVKIGDLVKVNYDGRLAATGKRFDIGDSTFMVGGGDMIIGFDSGVRGMRLHERRRIHIPYKLGYGKKGKKPKIPPNADLIFDVVLNHVGIDWDEKSVSAVSQSRREKMRQRNKKVRKT